MALVPGICTQCGAKIKIDDTKEAGICSQCGTAFITEKSINNYNTNVTNNIQADVVNVVSGQSCANFIKLCKKFLGKGNYSQARIYLLKALELDPDNKDANFYDVLLEFQKNYLIEISEEQYALDEVRFWGSTAHKNMIKVMLQNCDEQLVKDFINDYTSKLIVDGIEGKSKLYAGTSGFYKYIIEPLEENGFDCTEIKAKADELLQGKLEATLLGASSLDNGSYAVSRWSTQNNVMAIEIDLLKTMPNTQLILDRLVIFNERYIVYYEPSGIVPKNGNCIADLSQLKNLSLSIKTRMLHISNNQYFYLFSNGISVIKHQETVLANEASGESNKQFNLSNEYTKEQMYKLYKYLNANFNNFIIEEGNKFAEKYFRKFIKREEDEFNKENGLKPKKLSFFARIFGKK